MKTITIGRDPGCNITVDDNMISRRHAVLRIHPTGKMELVDMSSNGTFVNGVKLAGNVPFPLSRKDTVSFAKVRQLDWSLVPNPLSWVKWALLAIASLILIFILVLSLSKCSGGSDSFEEYEDSGTEVKSESSSKSSNDDSAEVKQEETSASSSDSKKEEGTTEGKDSKTEAKSKEKGSWADDMIRADEAKKAAAKKAAAAKGSTKKDTKKKDTKSPERHEGEGEYIPGM